MALADLPPELGSYSATPAHVNGVTMAAEVVLGPGLTVFQESGEWYACGAIAALGSSTK